MSWQYFAIRRKNDVYSSAESSICTPPSIKLSEERYFEPLWDDSEHKSNGADAAEQAEPSDFNRAPVDDLEEKSFDRPESLPVERFRPGITDFVLNMLLIAGLVALGGLYLLSLIS
jgi:hypothetical protein